MAKALAIYPYHDASGQVVYRKVRFPDKKFIWQHPVEDGWVDNQGDAPDVLYNLPAVLAAVAAGETVTVCEGEKDADTLNEMGYTATTPPHPSREWTPAMAMVLAGADVYVYWDNDESGHARGWYAIYACRLVGAHVACWHAPEANDLTEHIEQGGTPDTMVKGLPPQPQPGAPKPYTNGNGSTNGKVPTRLTVRSADLSRSERFKFVWDNRVLMGYFNLMVGEEGIGKGTLIAWMVANLTQGTLPGNLQGPQTAMFIGDEDSWDHIWTPRLAAAGADLNRCLQVEQMVDLTKDTEEVERLVVEHGVRLTFFDQLLDNLGYADSWKDKDVRQALHPLRRVADVTGTAMLASMHPNKKSNASFRDKVSGTPAFNALSRSSLYLARHPDQDDQVAVVRPKGNYNVDPPAFVFSIEGAEVVGKDRQTVETSKVVRWREEPLDKRLVLNGAEEGEQASQREEVADIIGEYFPPGVQEHAAAEIMERLGAEGITSKTTIRRARMSLGLHTRKNGNGGWHWYRAGL